MIDFLRIFLLPFSFLFWIVVTIRKFIYGSKLFKVLFRINIVQSKVSVICVGNIRVGGTGKSQIVMNLAQRLIEKQKNVAILSRGYKRKSKGFLEVDSFDFEKFGDEPVLMKMNLSSARIFVSENRRLAIQKINEMKEFDFILMDDGLQNLKVRKDFSIVLVDRNYFSEKLVERLLLPAGNLREPKKRIYDYDCVIYNSKFADEGVNIEHKNFFTARYKLVYFSDLDGKNYSLEEVQKFKSGAFCGIAQPDSFEELLRKNSIFLNFFKVFPDHYDYKIQDLKLLLKFVEKFGLNCLITTEKDIVRLVKFKDEFKRAEVFLIYAKITAEIKDEEKLIQNLLCLKQK
jgi:tetraacyldisaccharide 4'-kinase